MPRGLLLKAKRDNGHIFPTTIHTALVAGSTPSPQSLRDSSPQAGEQFKSTPLGVVFLRAKRATRAQKAVVPKVGFWLKTAVEYYKLSIFLRSFPTVSMTLQRMTPPVGATVNDFCFVVDE